MPQVDLSTFSSQIFWLVLVFGTLYFIVSRHIIPKAEYIMNERSGFIERNITKTEHYKQLAKEYEAKIKKNKNDVNLHVEDLQRKVLESLDSSFAHQQKELSIAINDQTIKAMSEIKASVNSFYVNEPASCVDLAAFIIEKITNKQADKQLLEKFLEKIK